MDTNEQEGQQMLIYIIKMKFNPYFIHNLMKIKQRNRAYNVELQCRTTSRY